MIILVLLKYFYSMVIMNCWYGIDEFLVVVEIGSFIKVSKLLGMLVVYVSCYVS